MEEKIQKKKRLDFKQRKFLACLPECGFSVGATAEKIGVAKTTAYRWLEKEHFQEAFNAALDRAVPLIEAAHIEKGLQKDTLARIHILKQRSERYREKPTEVQVQHQHQIGLAQGSEAIAAAALSVMQNVGLLPPPVDPVQQAKPVMEAAVVKDDDARS